MLAFENTNAVARYAASQSIVFGEDIDPDRAIAALDDVTYAGGCGGRRRAWIPMIWRWRCVRPHDTGDFAGRLRLAARTATITRAARD